MRSNRRWQGAQPSQRSSPLPPEIAQHWHGLRHKFLFGPLAFLSLQL